MQAQGRRQMSDGKEDFLQTRRPRAERLRNAEHACRVPLRWNALRASAYAYAGLGRQVTGFTNI